MRLSFKLLGSLTLGLCLAGSALSIGCASESTEESGDTTADITGTLGNARACAIESAYLAASVGDFTVLTKDELPFPTYSPIEYFTTYASLNVPGVGTIYYVENPISGDSGFGGITGTFYEPSGRIILTSYTGTAPTRFFAITGGELACSGSPGHTDAGTKDSSTPPHPGADGGSSEASAPHPHPVSDASAHD